MDQFQESEIRKLVNEWAPRILETRAVTPRQGGEGEKRRADVILSILKEIGVKDIKVITGNDRHKVSRPNVVGRFGFGEVTTWLVSHMDTIGVHKPLTALWND